jgi:hypothetical protein
VAIDDSLCSRAIVVKAGSGHALFDLSNRRLGRGDPGLELLDAGAPRLFGARFLARLGIGSLPVFTRWLPGRLYAISINFFPVALGPSPRRVLTG